MLIFGNSDSHPFGSTLANAMPAGTSESNRPMVISGYKDEMVVSDCVAEIVRVMTVLSAATNRIVFPADGKKCVANATCRGEISVPAFIFTPSLFHGEIQVSFCT